MAYSECFNAQTLIETSVEVCYGKYSMETSPKSENQTV